VFGPAESDFDRVRMALEEAARRQVVIVLKGHRTLVAAPGEVVAATGEVAAAPGEVAAAPGELAAAPVKAAAPGAVAPPRGTGIFNTTGNAGMATGGSGDVLTGILTGLLAQGYTGAQAAVLGVYLHGLAGDLALDEQSMESLTASGIVESLGKAFKHLAAGAYGG
jgi:NAD(P)H-hydrate epimerase